MNDREKHWEESQDDDAYEKVCYVCRRPESKAGNMISMPPGIDICHDCMQKAFDTMNQSGFDLNALSGISPEMLWNAGMPMNMWQMPVKNTNSTPQEPQKTSDAKTSDDTDTETEDSNAEEEDQTAGWGGMPMGNMGWGIPLGQIDLSAITGKKRVKKKKDNCL